jgi:hypothetical protein
MKESDMNNLKTTLALLAMTGTLASAHLKAGSLSVKGGETFIVGEVVKVTLVQNVGHNDGRYDFYYSIDGGTKWTEIVGGFLGPKGDGDTVKYSWTVPNKPTTTAQFRACQLAGGECVDANYILKSPNFTISTTSGVVAPGIAASAPTLRFDGLTNSLEAEFSLASAERVTLQILAADGRVVATLVDGNRDAGHHRFSVFSNSLATATGHYVLKLTLGSESITRSWNGLR